MKERRQPVLPVFVMLSGLLLVYLLLPLAGLLPRLSASTGRAWLQPDVVAAVAVSVETATVAILLLAVFGIPLAYLLARCDFGGKTFITLLVHLPLAVPPVVSGILLLMVFGPYAPVGGWFADRGLPLTDNLPAIVAAQAFVASPFLLVAARAAFEAVDPTLEQAAATLGQSPWEIFRRVSLPLAWPGIRSGIVLSWVRALGEFGATVVVAYHPHSLPVLAWVRFSGSGLDSTVPLVLLMLAVGAAGVALSHLLARSHWSAATSRSALTPGFSLASVPGTFRPAAAEPRRAAGRASTPYRSAGSPRGASRASERIQISLVKRLPGFTLDVAWTAGAGVTALFGPSGAGKTLTLHCLAGLIRPDEGRIVVDGRVFFDAAGGVELPPPQRRIGYVFQGYGLFPHLSVADNIAFGLRDRPRRERLRRAAEVIERLGLAGLERRYPRELSGGERQRVGLGRALAIDPALLLLDEPLSALDEPTRRALREELRATLNAFSTAAVVVTHDFTEAYRLADRVVVYADGRVIQSAARSELLWQPASEAVARITGIRNVLRGTVVKAAPDRIQLGWRGQTLEAANSPSRTYLPPPGSAIAFFIRPEYVRLIRKDRGVPDPSHHMNLMSGVIVGEADFGTTWTLMIRLDEPGAPAQGEYDLEVEVPRLVYEILEIDRDRRWQVSVHRGSIQVLPA